MCVNIQVVHSGPDSWIVEKDRSGGLRVRLFSSNPLSPCPSVVFELKSPRADITRYSITWTANMLIGFAPIPVESPSPLGTWVDQRGYRFDRTGVLYCDPECISQAIIPVMQKKTGVSDTVARELVRKLTSDVHLRTMYCNKFQPALPRAHRVVEGAFESSFRANPGDQCVVELDSVLGVLSVRRITSSTGEASAAASADAAASTSPEDSSMILWSNIPREPMLFPVISPCDPETRDPGTLIQLLPSCNVDPAVPSLPCLFL